MMQQCRHPGNGVFLLWDRRYAGGMTQFLELPSKRWHLLVAPSPKRILIAVAQLAHVTPLTVLDCGRRFDSSIVARAARGRQEVIDRVHIQRAFTCYEAARLLEQKRIEGTPIVVLDFLSTFYDENVKLDTRKFLLENSLHRFHRLGQCAGLAVSVYAPTASGDDSVSLFERLQAAAPALSAYALPDNPNPQLNLF